MKIGITGGSGFIGQALTSHFLEKGHEIVIFTRQDSVSSTNGVTFIKWDPTHHHVQEVPSLDAIINLAGATLNKKWSDAYKKKILDSRIDSAKTVYQLLLKQPHPPLLINASAIGYYGTSLEREFTEEDQVAPSDFLSEVTSKWEAALGPCQSLCSRVVPIRFGVVLGKDEGAFPKMVFPYRLFAGGKVGSGKQWVSWIHIHDLVRLIEFVLTHPDIRGPINGTAPNPVRMNDFGKTIAHVLKRPHLLPVPEWALKLLFGEMSVLLLKGQKVLPRQAIEHGFSFQFGELKAAIQDLLA